MLRSVYFVVILDCYKRLKFKPWYFHSAIIKTSTYERVFLYNLQKCQPFISANVMNFPDIKKFSIASSQQAMKHTFNFR